MAGFRNACAITRKLAEVKSFCASKKKQKKLKNLDFSEFVREGKLQKKEKRLAKQTYTNFFLKENGKIIREIRKNLANGFNEFKKMEANKRMDTVTTRMNSGCVEGCYGQWLQYTREVLNKIDAAKFFTSQRGLLGRGRGKNRNLMTRRRSINWAKI